MRPHRVTILSFPQLKAILFGFSILTSGCAEIIQNYEPRTPATTEEEPADTSIGSSGSTSGSGYDAPAKVETPPVLPKANSAGEVSEPAPVIEEYYPPSDGFVVVQMMPTPTHIVEPVYPLQANGQVETVWVKALVDKEGKVREAKIAKSSGSNLGFEEAALQAARQFEYKPAIQNGKPVAIWVTYPVEFKPK